MKNNWFYTLVLLVSLTAPAFAQSPWLLEASHFSVRPSFIYQHYDSFFMGKTEVDVPFGDSVDQFTVLNTFDYSITDDIAVDLTAGYTYSDVNGGAFDENDGLADTLIGARYNLVDEFEQENSYMPTLTLRVGGIIEGTYKESMPHSPGDGASGAEFSVQFGKILGETGVALFGDLGYRWRNHDVPEDFFASAGIFKQFENGFIVSSAYRHVQGLSGLDIGGPGFTPDRFPELDEEQHNVEFSLGYFDGVRTYNIFYARTVEGRNTGEKDIVGIAAIWPF